MSEWRSASFPPASRQCLIAASSTSWPVARVLSPCPGGVGWLFEPLTGFQSAQAAERPWLSDNHRQMADQWRMQGTHSICTTAHYTTRLLSTSYTTTQHQRRANHGQEHGAHDPKRATGRGRQIAPFRDGDAPEIGRTCAAFPAPPSCDVPCNIV